MQSTLTAPAASAPAIKPDDRAGKYLTFLIGKEEFGVGVLKVREIMGIQDITAVPQTPPYLKGVINLRGKIVSVMDLRKRFGEKHADLTKQNRILVVEHSGRLAGLIVDSASEVLKIPSDSVEAPPAVFQDGGLNCVTGLGKVRGRLIVLLDMSKLLAPGNLQAKPESDKTEKKVAAKPEARGAAAAR